MDHKKLFGDASSDNHKKSCKAHALQLFLLSFLLTCRFEETFPAAGHKETCPNQAGLQRQASEHTIV